MKQERNRYLRRYTTLSGALDILLNRHLMLLSPVKWDDQNDVRFMELYRASVSSGSVLALCFAMASETYHHWKVFTQGMEGICLEFHRSSLEATVAETANFKAQPVDYLLVRDIEALGPADRQRLPFIKRDGYKDEREWRIVATTPTKALQTLPMSIDLNSISRVILNPWMPNVLVDNLRKIVRQIPGCERLKIESSHLTNSERWKAAGSRIATL